MRIAAFNVENLFDRIKAFNDQDPETHKKVGQAYPQPRRATTYKILFKQTELPLGTITCFAFYFAG